MNKVKEELENKIFSLEIKKTVLTLQLDELLMIRDINNFRKTENKIRYIEKQMNNLYQFWENEERRDEIKNGTFKEYQSYFKRGTPDIATGIIRKKRNSGGTWIKVPNEYMY